MKHARSASLSLLPLLVLFLALYSFPSSPSEPAAPPTVEALAPVEVVAEGQQELVGVAVAPDGSAYFSDRMAGVVYRLRPSEPPATLLASLQRPAGLALDPEGRLLIAEEMAGQILRLEPDGTLTVLASGIKTPRWIAVSPEGSLYISAHRLQAPDGPDVSEGREILRLAADGSLSVVASGIRRLEGLALINGALIAATKGLESEADSPGMLLRYPILDGGILGTPLPWVDTGLKQPVGLVLDRLSSLYFSSKSVSVDSDTARLAIGKVHPDVHVTVFAEHLKDPQGVALGPDGSLYLADGKEGRLIRFRAPPAPGLIFPSFINQSPVLVNGVTESNSRVDAFFNNAGFATIFTQDGAFTLNLTLVLNAENTLVLFSTGQNGDGLSSAPAQAIITHDNLAPVIANLQPADGSFINNPTPVIRADFSDNLSEINSSSVEIILDGVNVTSQASISASGFTFTPDSLSEGTHAVSVTVADRAGNSAPVSSTFGVDLTSPQIVNLTPADGLTVTAARPLFSAEFTDNLSGIDLSSVQILVDGVDRTQQASVTSSGFTLDPASPATAEPFDLSQGSHTVSVFLTDGAGNTGSASSTFTVSLGPQLPPDPATVATPINRTTSTDLASATEFLYTGQNPIQTGVAPGTIEARRAAVLRGKVFDRDGNTLPSVAITVLNHPEFGSTLSRTDGAFDLAVNGGSALTVRYEKSGFLLAQRQINVPWQDYALLPDVVLVPLDPQVTTIELTSNAPIQVAQGTPVTDADGSRQASLLFRQGTQATVVLPDGSTEAVASLSVRATEYTVGPTGRAAMPAELPPTSGYTYAVEFSIDEAIAAAAKEVRFNQPIINYTDNFLNFPVGSIVPAGFYDREQGLWVPSQNGRVIKLLGVSSGLADLDTNGDGSVDNGVTLGITDVERQQLALLYPSGKSLWRVPITHFTPWDHNWPYGPPADARAPNQPRPQSKKPIDDPACRSGSIIECQNQILGEALNITGTPFALRYGSDRVPGYKPSLEIALSDSSVPASLKRIELEIMVAGQKFTQTFPATPNQSHAFIWDSKDAYGRTLQGAQPITTRIGYVYDAIYQEPAEFEQSFGALSGVPIVGSRARQEVTIWQEQRDTIGSWDARGQGLAGWSLNPHHAYEISARVLYLGDGGRRSAENIGSVITRVAGGGTNLGDGGPAVEGQIFARGTAVDREGNLFIADTSNNRIRKVDGNGIITTVAGTGTSGFSGDGGPAVNAQLSFPFDVAADGQGSLFIADSLNNRIRKVSSDGIITTVAGTGTSGFSGDGGPAVSAQFDLPVGVDVDSHGNIFIADRFNNRVRRVAPDGTITTVAGGGTSLGDFGPATSTSLSDTQDIAVDGQGNLFIADAGNGRVRKVSPSGIITTVAGTRSFEDFSGDGGPATSAGLSLPVGVAVDGKGNLYIADLFNNRIRRVNPAGIITTVAGNGAFGLGGDGGLATNAQVGFPNRVSVDKEDNLLIVQNTVVRKVQPLVPGFSGQAITIASEDGRELYGFDSTGRHLRTVDAFTVAIRYEFAYDGSGRLTAVTDGDGNITSVERDDNGNPAAIVAPGGQRTTVTLDTNGYLASVMDPAGNTSHFSYSTDGLLATMRDARGGLYQFAYDAFGRLTRHQDPAGGFSELARSDGANDFQVSLTTALGRVNNYRVERLSIGGTRRVDTDPSGIATTLLVGANGVRTTTSADGTVTTLTEGPDPRFGMQAPLVSSLRVATPAGRVSLTTTARSVTLTDPNNLLSLASLTDTTTINGRVFTNTYDATQRLWTSNSPLGRQRFTILDNKGRVAQDQIAGLEPTTFVYDTQGRLSTITQGAGLSARVQTFSYDAQNRISSITDPLMRTVGFAYDLAGRVAKQTLADGREINYAYDANGNVTSIAPPARPAHSFGYTTVNLEQSYISPNVGAGTNSTIYTYNTDKQLTQVLRPDGATINLGYDSGERLSTMTLSRGQIVYGYHPTTGNLTSITAPDGGTMAYAYDGSLLTSAIWNGTVIGSVGFTYNNDFRISSETINGSNTVNFLYDNDGLLSQSGALTLSRDSQNGLLTASTLGNVTDSFTYNTFGEPLNYQASYSGAMLFDVQYTRDKLGRITQKVETIQGVTDTFDYSYDLAGRLTEVKKNGTVVSSYSYDSNGNRLSLTTPTGTVNGTYDDQDRLLSYGGITYTYTANGELVSKTAGGQITTYSYDALGNLMAVSLPGATQIEYVIDGPNRRIGKKVNGVLVQGFLYQDQLRPIAELDGSNNVVSRFVYASKPNVPDYMIKAGVTYRIVSDHLGSPRLVIDASTGAVAQQMDYDEFGNITLDTNPGFQPFGFAAGLYDQHTKLTRFGARDYDAEIGRWTAKDPIRFVGGDTNLYGYVYNNPTTYIDPVGLFIVVGRVPAVVRTGPRQPRLTEPPPYPRNPQQLPPRQASPTDPKQPANQFRERIPEANEGPHEPLHPPCFDCPGGIVPPAPPPGGGSKDLAPFPIRELVPDPCT